MKLRSIRVGKRVLKATPVLDTYWRFAAERQSIFHKRVRSERPPWTDDQILANHRFTNVYRASDRVSQYLIRHVVYEGDSSPEEVFFRTILFKLFNRIDTWETLTQTAGGAVSWRQYDRRLFESTLDRLMAEGQSVYSAAYIMPSPAMGAKRKHANHLRLLEQMMTDRLADRVANGASLSEVYHRLREYKSIGPFLAFQLAIDLNYGPLMDGSEMDFVVAGPGARNGIRKCFSDTAGLSDAAVIEAVAELSTSEFARLGLRFRDLWGRSLQLIDCQNLFCEVDKYARVAHPDIHGISPRTKIKQRFDAQTRPVPQWYPPKWGLAPPATRLSPSCPRQRSLFGEADMLATS